MSQMVGKWNTDCAGCGWRGIMYSISFKLNLGDEHETFQWMGICPECGADGMRHFEKLASIRVPDGYYCGASEVGI